MTAYICLCLNPAEAIFCGIFFGAWLPSLVQFRMRHSKQICSPPVSLETQRAQRVFSYFFSEFNLCELCVSAVKENAGVHF